MKRLGVGTTMICVSLALALDAHGDQFGLRPNCKQEAMVCIATFKEYGFPVRVAYGPTTFSRNIYHVQGQAKINDTWVFLTLTSEDGSLFAEVSEKDDYFVIEQYFDEDEFHTFFKKEINKFWKNVLTVPERAAPPLSEMDAPRKPRFSPLSPATE